MKFPDKLDVLTAHARILEETGGSAGIRDEGLLDSALAAVLNRHTYEDVDLPACAATYMHIT
jgi:death-on-curing protein